jgi:hypothetical protein
MGVLAQLAVELGHPFAQGGRAALERHHEVARPEQHRERQRGREPGELVARRRQHVLEPLPALAAARVRELVHRPLREALVALRLPDGDQAGPLEPRDRLVEAGALPDIHDGVLVPKADQALQPVRVQGPDLARPRRARSGPPRDPGAGSHMNHRCLAPVIHPGRARSIQTAASGLPL